MGGALGNVPQLTMRASIANGYAARRHRQNFTQRLLRTDYAVTEMRRCANFRLRSRHCAASYASPPHRCHDSLTGGARGKFMGLRDPFTILRNVRDRTSPTAPSVDLVRFPSWRIACIKPNTACSAYHQK